MAFLCPVRIGRSKKKTPVEVEKDVVRANTGAGMGRITGSASIETLVRVGIEKENGISPDSKMVVLHDFTPCVDDELHVKRGQLVNILYRENDWVYVIAEDSRQEGFIPHSYCTPYHHVKLPRDPPPVDSEGEADYGATGVVTTGAVGGSQGSLHSSSGSTDVSPFSKDPMGRYIVLYTFIARDENDVSVERGEFVTVLNREDPDWFWVVRTDGQEGFVPSGFVYPADVVQSNNQAAGAAGGVTGGSQASYNNGQHNNPLSPEDQKYHGTELVMLYDYKAQAPDDLSVRRGDWIYADLPSQTVDGWLWAYAPKTRKYGFIPKAYARPPAMTCL